MLTGNLSRNKAILRALNFTNCCYTYKCIHIKQNFFERKNIRFCLTYIKLSQLFFRVNQSQTRRRVRLVQYDGPSQCRTLLLVIVRSQKRLMITIGKVIDLSLEKSIGARSVLIHTKCCTWILNASRVNIKADCANNL